ncbi:hypothetical protein [Phytohabitans rumicis]|uniref:hypothetical protein n=1 Tax=Phytohabitans rumicis TaxID=1076125 RepID=UPI00156689D7|nr:hypothetical protein [Phytohabitans rumicis]
MVTRDGSSDHAVRWAVDVFDEVSLMSTRLTHVFDGGSQPREKLTPKLPGWRTSPPGRCGSSAWPSCSVASR